MNNDGYSVSNVAAGTYGPFALVGGYYQLAAHATWSSGSLTLEQLLPDGVTYFPLSGQPSTTTPTTWVASLGADGVIYFKLPPGAYKLVFATGSGLSAAIERIPLQ